MGSKYGSSIGEKLTIAADTDKSERAEMQEASSEATEVQKEDEKLSNSNVSHLNTEVVDNPSKLRPLKVHP